MPLTKTGPVFSIRNVYIKKPTDPGWTQIPQVTSAAFKGTVTEVELVGDNALIGTLRHSQKGQLVVKASYTSMGILEMVTGVAGSVAGSVEVLWGGTDAELAPPILAVRAVMPVQRVDGTASGTLTATFFNSQVSTAYESIPGATYATLSEFTLTFNCYKSSTDENGANLPSGLRALFRIDMT